VFLNNEVPESIVSPVPPFEVVEILPGPTPESFLVKAREEYEAGRISSSIELLDQFCTFFPSGSDEAWWLYGQCYEANGTGRNILAALGYYRRLVDEYPQSSRVSDARRRISYIERYFINIR
jgi:outer membrane protein assembly factor BamD (BamD/ComL family)